MASLRTTYAPPSRWKVGESLLDSCYDRVEAEVKGYFDRAPVLIGASDTWNDVMGKSVTNLMLLTPEPFFLDSWMLDERRNRLKPERLRKLVFIYHNLHILARMKVTKEDRQREVAASALAVSAFDAAAMAAASGEPPPQNKLNRSIEVQ